MTAKGRVLVVDDKENMRRLLARVLGDEHEVTTAADGRQALERLAAGTYDVVLSDVRMPGPDGLEVLAEVRRTNPDTEVILMTAHGTIADAVAAIRRGAYDYLEKPFDPGEAALAVGRALEKKRLKEHAAALEREIDGISSFEQIVGKSPKMRALYEVLARAAAAADLTVLLLGETGTGKEVVARAIHKNSPRRAGPFVAVNCGALPAALIESELFGHAKGAFTGATSAHAGLFEEAHGGTLFLDEIGELPLALQVKLNRALQDRQIRRVGETLDRGVDVRVIAATLRDLKEDVASGRFREDLFYRLNVLTLRLPPLRERKEDIPLLAAHFLARIARRQDGPVAVPSAEALRLLLAWDWPGNVRELENALERAVALSPGATVEAAALPEELHGGGSSGAPQAELAQLPFKEALDLARERAARTYLVSLLREFQGNVGRAAERAGVERESFYRLLRKHGVDAATFRGGERQG